MELCNCWVCSNFFRHHHWIFQFRWNLIFCPLQHFQFIFLSLCVSNGSVQCVLQCIVLCTLATGIIYQTPFCHFVLSLKNYETIYYKYKKKYFMFFRSRREKNMAIKKNSDDLAPDKRVRELAHVWVWINGWFRAYRQRMYLLYVQRKSEQSRAIWWMLRELYSPSG